MSQPATILLPCPWCNSPAVYRETWCRSTHTDDPRFTGQKGLLESLRRMEIIECSNVDCPVLPRVVRIESGDAVTRWNHRATESNMVQL